MLAIFNPEHDLCLANGDANYVPPASALRFARQEAHLMKALYGDDTIALAAEDVNWSQVADGISTHTGHRSQITGHSSITAWGWDASLVRRLCKRGVPRELMPSDEQLETIRQLSHRRTALAAAEACGVSPKGVECFEMKEVQTSLGKYGRIVMKAPWSGSGRGLRWVDHTLSDLDKRWAEKVISSQGSVVVEPRCEVVQDFALEYYIHSPQPGTSPIITPNTPSTDHGSQVTGHQPQVSGQQSISPCASTHFLGYSLFATQNGVYRENLLLSDDEILQRLSGFVPLETISSAKTSIESWLQAYVAPKYEGPLGVDMFIYQTADGYALNPMVEVNFRHTMGHVAVALRGRTTAATFSPNTL